MKVEYSGLRRRIQGRMERGKRDSKPPSLPSRQFWAGSFLSNRYSEALKDTLNRSQKQKRDGEGGVQFASSKEKKGWRPRV